MNTENFDKAVEEYCNIYADHTALCEAFQWLAKEVWVASTYVPRVLDKDDIIQEAVLVCFEKRNKFNYHRKGKTAADFFTAVINSVYRHHCHFGGHNSKAKPSVVPYKPNKRWGNVRKSGW